MTYLKSNQLGVNNLSIIVIETVFILNALNVIIIFDIFPLLSNRGNDNRLLAFRPFFQANRGRDQGHKKVWLFQE